MNCKTAAIEDYVILVLDIQIVRINVFKVIFKV